MCKKLVTNRNLYVLLVISVLYYLTCNICTWLVTPDFCESSPNLIGPDFVLGYKRVSLYAQVVLAHANTIILPFSWLKPLTSPAGAPNITLVSGVG